MPASWRIWTGQEEPLVPLLDGAEFLHLLATWLRHNLASALPPVVKPVIAGRTASSAAGERELPGQVPRLTVGALDSAAVGAMA